MSDSFAFYLIDVFAEAPLTGNPLALVEGADGFDQVDMQAVAREFNQSETTFLLLPTRGEATWRLCSFTPSGAEVFGVGGTQRTRCLVVARVRWQASAERRFWPLRPRDR